MPTISKEPTYNLQVVLRETGIKPDTLRAWERRYGLPQPDRTAGGHRLYSQYDIEMIKWLIARQTEGMRINRAVKLWRNLEESGQDPLAAMPQPIPGVGVQAGAMEVFGGSTLDEMHQNWIEACMDYNEPVAENILAQAFARYPLETVCLEVLRKGLYEIGAMWYGGRITVQQEHFASALAIRRLDALIAAAPVPTRNGRILIACPPEEDHIFSPLLVTLFLRHRGWDVIYLGANVPMDRMEATIQTTKPNLIILTAMQLHTAANLYEMAMQLQQLGVPVAYGGLVFNLIPDLRRCIAGSFLGESLDNVIYSVERLLAFPQKPAQIEPISPAYLQALEQFQEKQPLIEAYLWDKFQSDGMRAYHLSIANEYLARDISAALRLGNLDYIHSELEWIRSLLENFNVPTELLPKYLCLYREAVETNMDEYAHPIVDWMDETIREAIES